MTSSVYSRRVFVSSSRSLCFARRSLHCGRAPHRNWAKARGILRRKAR